MVSDRLQRETLWDASRRNAPAPLPSQTVAWNMAMCNSQLGYGTQRGAEAAAHATRLYVRQKHNPDQISLKIDMKNAFKSISRDALLATVFAKPPLSTTKLKQLLLNPASCSTETKSSYRRKVLSKEIRKDAHYSLTQSMTPSGAFAVSLTSGTWMTETWQAPSRTCWTIIQLWEALFWLWDWKSTHRNVNWFF